jgi:hypothetical protein
MPGGSGDESAVTRGWIGWLAQHVCDFKLQPRLASADHFPTRLRNTGRLADTFPFRLSIIGEFIAGMSRIR